MSPVWYRIKWTKCIVNTRSLKTFSDAASSATTVSDVVVSCSCQGVVILKMNEPELNFMTNALPLHNHYLFSVQCFIWCTSMHHFSNPVSCVCSPDSTDHYIRVRDCGQGHGRKWGGPNRNSHCDHYHHWQEWPCAWIHTPTGENFTFLEKSTIVFRNCLLSESALFIIIVIDDVICYLHLNFPFFLSK